MSNLINLLNQRIDESITVKKKFSDDLKKSLLKTVDVLIKAYLKKKQIFIFGNGGSAADAQHFAAELVGRFLKEREPMDVTALTTNSSLLTALVNDYPPEQIFSRQVNAHVNKGDVVIGITTSGNSFNVIEGIKAAKKKGAFTVGLTGNSGGKLGSICDILLNIPSTSTPRIQESHILIIHLICEFVENNL